MPYVSQYYVLQFKVHNLGTIIIRPGLTLTSNNLHPIIMGKASALHSCYSSLFISMYICIPLLHSPAHSAALHVYPWNKARSCNIIRHQPVIVNSLHRPSVLPPHSSTLRQLPGSQTQRLLNYLSDSL